MPEYREHGIFREMMVYLVKEAKKRGHEALTVKSYKRFRPMLKALAAFGFVTSDKGNSLLFTKQPHK